MGYINNLSMVNANLTNYGLVNNTAMHGQSNATNYGSMNNTAMFGASTATNNGFMGNLAMTDQTMATNNGYAGNVGINSFDGDNVKYNNTGHTQNLAANVFSPANNGFAFINNAQGGSMTNVSLVDNVPVPPPPQARPDYIGFNNAGNVQNLTAQTLGAGHIDIFNQSTGSIWNMFANSSQGGNIGIWNMA
jgi:hypothetical protein